MQVHTKKHPTDDMVTLRLKVHRHNAPLVRRYAETIESEEDRTYKVAEVFGLCMTDVERIERVKYGADRF